MTANGMQIVLYSTRRNILVNYENSENILLQLANMFRHEQVVMQSEHGSDPRAINLWNVHEFWWRFFNTPAQGGV